MAFRHGIRDSYTVFVSGVEQSITQNLLDWRQGSPEALERLIASVYGELRRVAGGIVRSQGNQTIQPTALVHELYLRLPAIQNTDWESRAHFLNLSARIMRNVLVDYARMRSAAKRGGGEIGIVLDDIPSKDGIAGNLDVLLVHEALEALAVDYPRQARVVELRFFGGMTVEETSEVMGVTWDRECSVRTVARDWTFARAWLMNRIDTGDAR